MKNKPTETAERINMQPLVSILGSQPALGFKTQFIVTEQGLLSLTTQKTFQAIEIKVVYFFRFEGESDPSDNAILYAIETIDGEKGTIADAYGPYNDSLVTNFLQQVNIRRGNLTN